MTGTEPPPRSGSGRGPPPIETRLTVHYIPAMLIRRTLISISVAALAWAPAACDDGADPSDPEEEEAAEAEEAPDDEPDDGAETHRYTVRGEIEDLPADEGDAVQIHHEEVPDFVDRAGEETGMDSMSMPFGLGDDVSLEALEEGDLVEFTFEVDWEDPQVSRVVEIEPLPEDAELDLE